MTNQNINYLIKSHNLNINITNNKVKHQFK